MDSGCLMELKPNLFIDNSLNFGPNFPMLF